MELADRGGRADALSREAARVGDLLQARGLTLAVAESCTGGMLAARMTDRPGASAFLLAGFVTYADEAKRRLLGVRPESLAGHGAVSEIVAREMVLGAREATGADVAVSITGVAGPGGGSAEKPVGTVWIAAAIGDRVVAERFRFDGDRAAVRSRSVLASIGLLQELLQEEGGWGPS